MFCSGGISHAGELKPFDVRRLEPAVGGDISGSKPPGKQAARAGLLRSGTAFFVSRTGEMLTSAHVVQGCKRINVWPGEEPPIQATLIAVDKDLDAALLSTDRPVDMIAERTGQSVGTGASIYTIGFALTASSPRVPVITRGDVNGTVENNGRRLLVLRAALHEGNSGGPVVDAKGVLRGMIIGRYADRPELSVAVRAQDLARFLGSDHGDMSALPPHPPVALKVSARLKQIAALVQCEK
ncbi:serine protease [Paraburkholderia sp. C35]|uniref:S1 family peptidase n=1 Tax=Paraburkholderia sp. C35 TaxID=2126993 RepID=UPI00194EDAD7|nr:serine protease [Paraburkholderia sp. C35]